MTDYDDLIHELEYKLEKEDSLKNSVLLKDAIKILKELKNREK